MRVAHEEIMLQRYIRLALFASLLLAFLSACGGKTEPAYTLNGTILEPPSEAADFELIAHTGEPWKLSDQRGKVVLIFFGFTSCPDICPTTLATMSTVFRELGDDVENVELAFITLDPERDTLKRLEKYMSIFNPKFTGLFASEADMAPIAKAYGVTYERREMPESALKYTIDHTPFIYVIDKNGMWRELLQDDLPLEDLVNDIRYLAQQKG
jgi:protein SCO1/2